MRFCPSRENAEVHTKRTKMNLPEKRKIGILSITARQFAAMELYFRKKSVEPEKPIQQLELF
jgi:CRISPR-associated protein Cas2